MSTATFTKEPDGLDRFEGQIAVVTGAGSGIGEACARLLAAGGAHVVAVDSNATNAERLATSIGGTSVIVDVTDAESLEAAARHVEEETGPVDVLITSAGIAQRPTRPEDLSYDDWDLVMAVDLRGTYASAVAFGSHMCLRRRGSVVTIASVTGMRSTPLHSYGVAKAGVIRMTSNLAGEWGRSGVRVNCVSPGYTLTPLLQSLADRGERDLDALRSESALGSLVDPIDVAEAVCFLASDAARAITGINLPVDCGWLAAPPWRTYGGVPKSR